MKRLYKSFMMASAAAAVVLSAASCDKEWLQPKPLSFFTPENTYIDAAGFSSALIAAERNMTHEFVDEYAPIMTEMYFSDVAVYGKTDASKGLYNYDTSCLPTTMASGETNRLEWYWQESFYGVKYANIVISRIDDAKYNSQEERNAVLAAALFQRAYRYYKMVHQFGDIPFLAEEIASPKTDFQSHDRWDILAQLEKDMEFAYKWCAENVDRGRTSKAACGVLLMKIYMCRAEWDKAIAIGKEIVAKYPMMTARFGKDKNDAQKNLQFDLHSVEAKLDMSNTEGLMYVVSYPGMENCKRSQTMRNATPYWAKGAAIKTPDGKTGTQNSLPVGDKDKNTYLDNDLYVGRGIGSMRPSSYYQYDIWGPKEKNDQRGPLYGEGTGYNTTKSWRFMEDLYYNNTGLRGKSEYWGKPLEYPTGLSAADSIRCWFKWPHYKLFVPDPIVEVDRRGGETPWYVYRTAEVYLMLAECYYWKDDKSNAAEMLNVVRRRAGAEDLTASEINIGAVLDERARELYYEEPRHVEITRIAYTYALTGKPCEVFNNTVYKLDNFDGPKGPSTFTKEMGYNFWYDWVSTKNNFFRDKVTCSLGTYQISVHHVHFPVSNSAITSNTQAVLNQCNGYPGCENNVPALRLEIKEVK